MAQFFKTLAATILGFFISIFILFIIGGILLAGMASALGDKKIKTRKDMVLELNLNYQIEERTEDNPIMELLDKTSTQPLGLDELLYNIKRAKEDDNVRGILLKPGMLAAGFGTIDEIRNALIDFKKSDKFLYAYCEFITEKSYLLASVCDSIILNPAGEVVLNGLSSNLLFYKGMLEKLGVEMELFKVGTHKGAAEVFTQDGMSEANRGQIQRYLNVLFDNFCKAASNSRNIDFESFKQSIVNFSIQSPEAALNAKLIDNIWYEDELAQIIKEKVGKKPDQKICYTSFSDYRKMDGPSLRNYKSKNKIAVVYITGEISNNSSNENQSGCKSLLGSLRKVRYGDEYKALVLRVNSPGGSAFGSDQIWREIELIKAKKPVIVSMGDVAASGGYYVAAPADSIIVSPYTITGSIGVFGLYPNMKKLLNEKLGLKYESVSTGDYASMGLPDRGFNENEKIIIQRAVNRIYRNFTKVVEVGRGLDSSTVENIAQGKVWIASDAINHKLADSYGFLQDAINAASYIAGIEDADYTIKYLPVQEDPFSGLFKLGAKSKNKLMKEELGVFYPAFEMFKNVQNVGGGFYMRMPYLPLFD
jgi:protease-4